MAFVQVGTRYFLGISFDWFEEGSRFVAVFVTFLGAGIGVRTGAHFSMDLVVNALPPRIGKVLQVGIGLFSSACFAMVAYYGFFLVSKNYKYGVTSAAIGCPMWVVYLSIPVLSIVISLRFFIVAVNKFRGNSEVKGGE